MLTAALIYDRLPVVDVLRRVAAGTVLGLMDLRGLDEPFFFVLDRAGQDAPGPLVSRRWWWPASTR